VKRVLLFLMLLMSSVAFATVTNQSVSITFSCSGSTGPYAFSFPISDPTALTVTQDGVVLSSSTYTVTPVNNNYANGGSVTLNVACNSPSTLVLERVTPVTQTTVYTDNMPTPMKSFERSLDKLTEISIEQQNSYGNWTCPGGEVSTGFSLNLPLCGTVSPAGGTWQSPGPIGSNTPNTGAFTSLNNVVYVTSATSGSDFCAKLTTGIATAVANGLNQVVSTLTGAQTCASPTTISNGDLDIALGNISITPTTQFLIVSAGTPNVHIHGKQANGSSNDSNGTYINCSGATSSNPCVVVGTSSSDTPGFQWDFSTIRLVGASTSAIGLQLNRGVNYLMLYPTVYGSTTASNTQKLIDLEGTGNFTGGVMISPYTANGGYGIYLGTSANDNTIVGGWNPGISTSTGVVIKGNGNHIIGGYDVENRAQAWEISGNSNYINSQAESNTASLLLDSGASDNTVRSSFIGTVAPVDNSGNHTNSMEAPGVTIPAWDGVGNFTLKTFLDAGLQWTIQPGNSADQSFVIVARNHSGSTWYGTGVTNTGVVFLDDGNGSFYRFRADSGSNSYINTGSGSNSLYVNASAGSGTGGIVVDSGGGSPSQVGAIDGSGNLSVNGSATIGGESSKATYLACYTTGGKLGHCASVPSGTPPTCGCTNP